MPRAEPTSSLPECGFTLRGNTCHTTGDHFCTLRADHAQAFCEELCVHTKDEWARRPFILADWQRDDIVRPLFGEVRWSEEWQRYVRRFRLCWIEVARKNGKALPVDTPILSGTGWTTMGQLTVGDHVHAPDGSRTRVVAVGPTHERDCYRVVFADGRELVAADSHMWTVHDRLTGTERVVSTVDLARGVRYGRRGDRRWRVPVPIALDREPVELPLDPYLLGAWLGDGTSRRGEITTADMPVYAAFHSAGYRHSYLYGRGQAATVGLPGLQRVLADLGVLGDKHIPAQYLTGSADQRQALLAGLMDTDGGVTVGPNTPRAEFSTTNRALAVGVLWLARSLGYKPTLVRRPGHWRVGFTAWRGEGLFRLPRKDRLLADRAAATRSHMITIVGVHPVGPRQVRCIQVAHPSGCFLAGEHLVPTHNSELLAFIALYLLVADGVEGAEIYGCAKDREQASKVFDVAARMVQLSPVLAKRLIVKQHIKRIVDEKTNSYY
jgi:hypothetical protein